MTTTIDHIDVGASVAGAARAFAATLDHEQRAQLLRDRTPANLGNWSNYPQQVLGRRHRRVGLTTASLDQRQWAALDELLGTALSAAGAARVRGHLAADDHLLAIGGTHGYGRGEFVVAFLGTPATEGTWQLQFGGHHLAVALTYVDGQLQGATPTFRGIEPAVAFAHDGERHHPEQQLHSGLVRMLAALDQDERIVARLHGHHDDLLLGPGKDWKFPKRRDGLQVNRLDGTQRQLVLDAIAGFVDDVDDDNATRIMTRYAAELDETRIGWSGSVQLRGVGDYVRIDGPSVWIEFSLHDGIVCAGPHPHAVWRDRVTDYGNTHF